MTGYEEEGDVFVPPPPPPPPPTAVAAPAASLPLPPLNLRSSAANPLHASGHKISSLHTGSIERLPWQNDSSPGQSHCGETIPGNGNIRIPLLDAITDNSDGVKPGCIFARRLTLELDPESEFPQKDTKTGPRFTQVPKFRFSSSGNHPSPRSFSEDSSLPGDVIRLIAQGQAKSTGHSKQESRSMSLGGHSPGPLIQNLVSESPDYMLVSAKFAEGHLILTDREGLVQKITESESEANFDPRSLTLGDGGAANSARSWGVSGPGAQPPQGVADSAQDSGSKVRIDITHADDANESLEVSARKDSVGLNVLPWIRAPPTSAVEEERRE